MKHGLFLNILHKKKRDSVNLELLLLKEYYNYPLVKLYSKKVSLKYRKLFKKRK